MPSELSEFLSSNASAIFGLAGALCGGVLSFIASVMLKKRDFNLQMWSKLIERRIAAHENVISLAVEMWVMVGLGGTDEHGQLRRAPKVLLSKEEFEGWFIRFTQLTMEGTSWLTVETKREVNFAQDYLVTLHTHLKLIPSEEYLRVGELIRQDFIDLSSSLEKKTFDFFQHGIHKLKLDSLDKHHKYKRPETERRLSETNLLRNLAHLKAPTELVAIVD
jgi:hypothetical protein